MKAYLTRDSVSAGDDLHAPHARVISLQQDWDPASIASQILRVYDIPKIDGGRATWALSSNIPFVVFAQQWEKPQPINEVNLDPTEVDFDGEELRLHWTYFAQIDPEVVLGILRSLRLRAIQS
jgi:hypothetical protein